MNSNGKRRLQLLAAILLVPLALLLRLNGIDWDSSALLHPDERFITYVIESLRPPDTVADYFDTAHSPLNPHNTGHAFYVYGTFPLFLIKAVASAAGSNSFLIPGRAISAVFDTGTVVITMFLTFLLFGGNAALIAGILGAFCVLQIQLSHFGTFDTIAAFWSTLALYLATLIASRSSSRRAWHLAVFFGVAVALCAACKFNLALVGLTLIPALVQYKGSTIRKFSLLLAALDSAIIIFRIAQPYTFTGPGFLNFSLNPAVADNFIQLSAMAKYGTAYPPSLQWIDRGPLFALRNMLTWGMGLPAGILVMCSFLAALFFLFRKRDSRLFILLLWSITGYLAYGALARTPTLRYELPIYPSLFALTGWAFAALWNRGRLPFARPLLWLASAALAGAPLWALAFSRIYREDHTRNAAAKWAVNNIPKGAILVYETEWDDRLPFWATDMTSARAFYKNAPRLEVFKPDSPEKMLRLASILSWADYLVITSNRAWGSIGRLPSYFPATVNFYKRLLACGEEAIPRCYGRAEPSEAGGELGFKVLKTFASYPGFLNLHLNDQGAEEAFSVYDHPKVIILKKEKQLSQDDLVRLLFSP